MIISVYDTEQGLKRNIYINNSVPLNNFIIQYIILYQMSIFTIN